MKVAWAGDELIDPNLLVLLAAPRRALSYPRPTPLLAADLSPSEFIRAEGLPVTQTHTHTHNAYTHIHNTDTIHTRTHTHCILHTHTNTHNNTYCVYNFFKFNLIFILQNKRFEIEFYLVFSNSILFQIQFNRIWFCVYQMKLQLIGTPNLVPINFTKKFNLFINNTFSNNSN